MWYIGDHIPFTFPFWLKDVCFFFHKELNFFLERSAYNIPLELRFISYNPVLINKLVKRN